MTMNDPNVLARTDIIATPPLKRRYGWAIPVIIGSLLIASFFAYFVKITKIPIAPNAPETSGQSTH